jgi:hypothetical protein
MIFVCGLAGAIVGLAGGLWMIAALFLIRRRLTYLARGLRGWEWGSVAGIPVFVGGIGWARRLVIPPVAACQEVYLGAAVAVLVLSSGYFLLGLIAWCGRNSRR